MLSLLHVTKTYHYRPVLMDVQLSLQAGEFYALMAPNGAGKTTLLHMMAGISRPTEGRVVWAGAPFGAKHRRWIGAVLQAPMIYGDLSARENLVFFARLYGVQNPVEVSDEWLKRVGLEETGDQKARGFSKGMKQRLAVARSLIHHPKLLLLDEPFDGLDAKQSAVVRALIEDQYRRGTTVFMVTHQPDDAQMANQQLTIQHGDVIRV